MGSCGTGGGQLVRTRSVSCPGCTKHHKAACTRRHKLESSQSQLTYTLDKGEYAGSAAIDSRGAGLLTATKCASSSCLHECCKHTVHG